MLRAFVGGDEQAAVRAAGDADQFQIVRG
jgi:hypothetical protein